MFLYHWRIPDEFSWVSITGGGATAAAADSTTHSRKNSFILYCTHCASCSTLQFGHVTGNKQTTFSLLQFAGWHINNQEQNASLMFSIYWRQLVVCMESTEYDWWTWLQIFLFCFFAKQLTMTQTGFASEWEWKHTHRITIKQTNNCMAQKVRMTESQEKYA